MKIAPTKAENRKLGACENGRSQPAVMEVIALSGDMPVTLMAEFVTPEPIDITAKKEESPAEPVPSEASESAAREASDAPAIADPYHTDVYPNNIYSEKSIYDGDGNLIGKATTIPAAFGPDTIWIDGHAFYNVPGFGLVEWGGPSQRTKDYTMYESGVKVGIMGIEDEAPSHHAPTTPLPDWSESIGEVIDQTINTRPERNSTPPDYRQDAVLPNDPEARDIE